MHLKAIEIFGFKSFANKTRIDFDSGHTAIVGPNGCGKSNIVDALRWALGEQRPTTLRSDKMDNIIFNGCEAKKPMSMAEVSLFIENTKNILPSDYSQVQITRRLYRSGESDYLINKKTSRLKDIVDLFMDTGMGADAYSVIELKQIETILSNRADDRKKLFEEAAGVNKYKMRRESALRKLDATQQDLAQVQNIITEIQRNVDSLGRQVKKAERYEKLLGKSNNLRQYIYRAEMNLISGQIKPKQNSLNEIRNQIENMKGKEAVLEGRIEEIQTSLIGEEQKLSSHQEELNRLNKEAGQFEQSLARKKEQLSFSEKRIIEIKQDKKRFIQQKEETGHEISRLTDEIAAGQKELTAKQAVYEKLKKETEQFNEKYTAEKRKIQLHNTKTIETHKILNDRILQRDSLARSIEERRERLESITREMESIRAQLQYKKRRLKEEQDRLFEIQKNLKGLDKESTEKQADLESLEFQLNELREKSFHSKMKLESSRSRLKFLQSLITNHEGVQDGERFLLSNRKDIPGLMGTLVEMISAAPEHTRAIEHALGEAGTYLVFDTRENALNAISILKSQNSGKATMIPLDTIPAAPGFSLDEYRGDGAVGWAMDLITYPDKIEIILTHLLAKTLIVKDCTEFLLKKELTTEKIIDLNANVTFQTGIFRSGSPEEKKQDLIGTGDEITSLEKEISMLNLEIKQVEQESGELEKQLENSRLQQKDTQKSKQGIETGLREHEKEIAYLEVEIKRDEELLTKNTSVKEQLTLFEPDEKTLDELNDKIDALEHERNAIAQEGEELSRHEQQLEAERREIESRRNTAQVAQIQQEEAMKRLTGDLDRNRNQEISLGELIMQSEKQIEDLKQSIENLTKEIKDIEEKLIAVIEKRDNQENTVQTHHERVQGIRSKLYEEEKQYNSLKRQRNDLTENRHGLELELSKLDGRIQHIQENIDSDVKPDENEVYDEETLTEKKAEIENIEQRLASFGPVNALAAEEYKMQKERLDFLIQQRDDLNKAADDLLETIKKINTAATERFSETFDSIRTHFQSVYQLLFEEGKGDIQLTNPQDPLDSDIEIFSKPFGKRINSTSLLSGGEKTLTAIALLFAIYRIKPSPFCILDEVDAPLDDSNTRRFLRVLDEFSKDTQFITVTHNKKTMENSRYLYGVTMETKGISKIVSVRFDNGTVEV